MNTTHLALCGLGPMGAPIAERILSSNTPLTVWNRTASRTERFAERGASIAATPARAATPIVLTVLPDLAEVEDLVQRSDGLLAGWAARAITTPVLVIHGTTSPVATAEFARRMADANRVIVIDAPLSGGTVGAAEGSLSIMVGGDEVTATNLGPTFQKYGKVIRYFGAAGSGALAKACNQIVVASTVAAIAESLSLADRAGLDRSKLIEVLSGGLAASEVLRQKKSKWIHNDYHEGGSASNQLKDLRFVRDAARALSIELPVSESVFTLFDRMVAQGYGHLDHTGVIRTIVDSEGRTSE